MKKGFLALINVFIIDSSLVGHTLWAREVMEGAVMVDNVKVYIDPAKFDSTLYMSGPPVGVEEQEDMKAVERWQELRSKAMAERSRADSQQTVFLFADALGESSPIKTFRLPRSFSTLCKRRKAT